MDVEDIQASVGRQGCEAHVHLACLVKYDFPGADRISHFHIGVCQAISGNPGVFELAKLALKRVY
ncbi:uncharacterized protein PHALS_04844 [Plasmopara halstedii]|uniref:Uncharacterized protein n=1 Tax=Plasmopara halstedii TaxID=4781 RepID=A0A0N7L7Q1_PLAHL|nr:uncharacterized protein PHALS_04844 [Plasmopara halstedii]CEG47699.1 hypothetical protein PHALS_04844 [Plasmopara halstedii]|eukprot:XP_024584068.1 hypothetical protein PHALS_04844 [Plasmopara halstedii]